jgi:hypothetical protein
MALFDELNNEEKFISQQRESIQDSYDSKNLIFRGIVVDVDRYGGAQILESGRRIAPGSLKVYIPGMTATNDVESMNYYEPLLPIHICPIPEIREEVLILFESQNRTKGYWIKRNDSDIINYQIPNPVFDEGSVEDRVRFGENLTEGGQPYSWKETEEQPDRKMVIPKWRRKPGDIPIEGRSNTLILQTFNIDNKKGVIDIVTERSGGTYGDKNDESLIKDREFQSTKGSRIMLVTKHNIDTNKDWDLTSKPGFASPDVTHLPAPYIYMESEQFRFYSRNSQYKMNNAVLGNEQEKWLKQLIQYIIQLCQLLQLPGQHITTEPGQPTGNCLIQSGISSVSNAISALGQTIKLHHSKVNFLN